jgi:hypothetical protein
MAGEIDPVRIVDDAIEDGVGVGGIADQLVPFVDGDLAGDDRRSAAVSFFENLEQVMTSGGIEGLEPPVVEDEQLDAAERALDASIATIAASKREVGEELGNEAVTSSSTRGISRAFARPSKQSFRDLSFPKKIISLRSDDAATFFDPTRQRRWQSTHDILLIEKYLTPISSSPPLIPSPTRII